MDSVELVIFFVFGFLLLSLLYMGMVVLAALYDNSELALAQLRVTSMNVNRLRQMSDLQQTRVQVMGLGEMINHVLGDIDNNNARETRAPRRGPRTRSDARAAASAA